MKICPNCGSKMESSVNFCTTCGTDIRNVAPIGEQTQATNKVEANAQQSQPAQEQSTVNTTTQQSRSDSTANNVQPDQQNNQNQYQYNSINSAGNTESRQNTASAVGDRISQAVREFDAHSMWNWFVNSWKHPFAEQRAEKWYGWVTLLVEDVLFGIGLFIGEQRVTGAADSMLGSTNLMGSTSNFSFGVAIELIIFVALAQFAWLGAAYLAYKVIYGHSKDFLELTNHVVQTSNLSAIFMVVFFVFMALMGPAGVTISSLMVILSIGFFSMALSVVVLGDPNPVHDKFYGYLLFVVLQFITGLIVTMIISGTVASQIGSSLHLF